MTPTPKLTPAQRRVIDNLKAGRSPTSHLRRPLNGARAIQGVAKTVAWLESQGLVDRSHPGGPILTEKGKSL